MTEVLAQIVRDGAQASPAADEDGPVLSEADRRAAFLSIVGEILREADAAFRPEPLLYQDFGVRCRIARVGPVPTLAAFRLLLNAGRAGVDSAEDVEAWGGAIEAARAVPDDLQAVFLILAGAALSRRPCPSDAEIAARCGQHAPGRARSRIGHLEKSGFVVMRPGAAGLRAAVLPDLGWETAWGDAAAPVEMPARRLPAAG